MVTFSALWSGFVIRHHSYGGDSRLSQLGGTLVFFGAYLFPILVSALLVFVPLTKFALIRKKSDWSAIRWRLLTWILVTVSVLTGIVASATPEHGFAALACGLAAAISGALIHERIISGASKNKHS